MRKMLTAIALSLAAATAGAHEGHQAKNATRTLTGEVIDITCYLDHDSSGPKHAACARKCLEKGLPAGLLVDGKVYNVILSNHESASAKLAPFAGQRVTVTGTIVEKNGLRAIDLDTVELVAAAAATK